MTVSMKSYPYWLMLPSTMFPVLPAEVRGKIIIKDWAMPLMEYAMLIQKMEDVSHYSRYSSPIIAFLIVHTALAAKATILNVLPSPFRK